MRVAYFDPIHDFAFLKFDPKAVKYMAVEALELRPDLAEGELVVSFDLVLHFDFLF